MRRAALFLLSLLVVACATAPIPHPPIGVMWGYLGTAANPPTLEIVVYAPDRPSCEFSRAMAQTRTGLPVPAYIAAQCEPLAVLPYREGGDSVYWVFGTESDQFAAGGNDRGLCASLRQMALQALRPGDTLSECEPVIVKRVR
ncbi:MAG TPA: hypothetical protein VGL14_03635 [Methylomirabilota bacterium]